MTVLLERLDRLITSVEELQYELGQRLADLRRHRAERLEVRL